jgi:hypothetical protein
MFRDRTLDFKKIKGDRPRSVVQTPVVTKFTILYQKIKDNLSFLKTAINSLYILHSQMMIVIIDRHYENGLQNMMIDNIKEIKILISQIHSQLNLLEKESISIIIKNHVIYILRNKFKDLKYDFHHTCTDYKNKLEYWDEQSKNIHHELFDNL